MDQLSEIRIWRMRVISLTLKESWGGSEWIPDTPENRANCQLLLNSALKKYGPGTHWIEERQPPSARTGRPWPEEPQPSGAL